MHSQQTGVPRIMAFSLRPQLPPRPSVKIRRAQIYLVGNLPEVSCRLTFSLTIQKTSIRNIEDGLTVEGHNLKHFCLISSGQNKA